MQQQTSLSSFKDWMHPSLLSKHGVERVTAQIHSAASLSRALTWEAEPSRQRCPCSALGSSVVGRQVKETRHRANAYHGEQFQKQALETKLYPFAQKAKTDFSEVVPGGTFFIFGVLGRRSFLYIKLHIIPPVTWARGDSSFVCAFLVWRWAPLIKWIPAPASELQKSGVFMDII